MELTAQLQKENTSNQPLDKMLIYDEDCPLCQAYSGAFVQMGLLKSENRISFKQLRDETFDGKIDSVRSKNEIPLVDANGGETLYGTDALIAILSSKWHFFRHFKTNPVLNWLSKKAYAFISYNRKVIVPSVKNPGVIDCSPGVHIPWRLCFIALAFVVGSLPLFSTYIDRQERNILFIPVILQCISALFMSRSKWLDYIGNLSMIWLIQGVLLYIISCLPLQGIAMVSMPAIFALVYFEHYRRAKILMYTFPIHIIWLINQSIIWVLMA